MGTNLAAALGLTADAVRGHEWVDNGPGWCAVLLESAEAVPALQPDWAALGETKLGVVGPEAPGLETAFELRAFFAEVATFLLNRP